MSEKILTEVSDAILQRDIEIEVEIRPIHWLHDMMQRLGMKQKTHKYYLKPVTMGVLIQISKMIISIDMSIYDIQNLMESNYQAIVKHGETACKVVAIAIHGTRGDVPQHLVDTVMNNFTTKELQTTLSLVLGQMDVSNFMSSIISIKGSMEILEMNPSEQGSQIAPGELLAAS